MNGKAKKKVQKKRFPVFYTVLIVFLLLGIIAVAIGLGYLKDFLADFEGAQYKYVAQEVFSEQFADPDIDKLLETSEYKISPYEKKEDLVSYIKSTLTGDITFKEVKTGVGSEDITYNVKAGDTKFAAFTLEKSGEKSKYGSDYYRLGQIRLIYTQPSMDVRIKAPADCTVCVNGIPVAGGEEITEEIRTTSCDHMPEGVSGLIYRVYTISGLMNKPEITVTDRHGNPSPLAYDDEGGMYVAGINYNTALEAEYSEMVIDAAEKYAAYMQCDGSFTLFAKYFDPSSVLYNQIKTAEYYFVWKHNGYDFENVKIGEFTDYDDDTFSCHVSFTHILHKTGSEDYRDPIDMIYYLRRVGDKFLIYDSEIPE